MNELFDTLHRRMDPGERVIALAVLVVSALGAAACDSARFPVCKSNADCSDPDAGHAGTVCFNLKCVECHYDSDCDAGTCNSVQECVRIEKPVAERTDAAAEDKVIWDFANWDQCAAQCKDKACIAKCDAKFKHAPTE